MRQWGTVVKVLGVTAFVLVALIGSAIAAVYIAEQMANAGMLGSCFEGACGYTALFGAFPVLWIALFTATMVGYAIWSKRSRR